MKTLGKIAEGLFWTSLAVIIGVLIAVISNYFGAVR